MALRNRGEAAKAAAAEYRCDPLQAETAKIVARPLSAAAEQQLAASAEEISQRFRAGRPPRLVAFDIDGTLLDHRNSLSARVVELLRDLDRTDTRVVIATGRSLVELLPVLAALALPDLWVVCSNGAVILHTRAEAGQAPDEAGEAAQGEAAGGVGAAAHPTQGAGGAVDAAAAHPTQGAAVHYRVVDVITFDPAGPARALQAAFPEAIFATELLGRGFAVTQRFPDGEIIGEQVEAPFAEVMAAPSAKLVARVVGMERDEFEHQIDAIGLTEVQWCVGWGAWMDAAPPGVSKATGLQRLAAELGIEAAEAVTVGDSTNDIEMFTWAAHAIGIGSGNPRALAAADVVVPGVLEDGAAAPLRAMLEAEAAGGEAAGGEAGGDTAGPATSAATSAVTSA